MVSVALSFAIALSSGTQYQDTSRKKYIEFSKNTLQLSCWTAEDNEEGSRLARSDIVVSPDGRYSAFVETEALFAVQDEEPLNPFGAKCVAISKLFVAGLNGDAFDTQLVLEPISRYGTLAGMKPIDWSSDSRYLLVEWQRSSYESEWSGHNVLLFDAKTRRFLRPDIYRALSEYFSRDCWALASAEGFTLDNRVVVGAFPDQYEPESSCVQDTHVFLFDPREETLKPLPKDYSVQRYGTVKGQGWKQ
jgi:hypothetical protein